MHHLINELRPHQARESIRVSLQVQKKQRMETTTRLNKQIERVQEMIKNATEGIADYDIDTIIQETLPENFIRPSFLTNAENGQSPSQGSHLLNGNTVSIPSSSTINGYTDADESISKMFHLDAFMCEMVDEIF